jgi:hypothetical protein
VGAQKAAPNGAATPFHGEDGPRQAALRALIDAAGERSEIVDDWFITPEKVLWRWPDVEDWIVTEAG